MYERDGRGISEHRPDRYDDRDARRFVASSAPGCDDQFEFEFALDLMLDGLEKLKERHA